MTSKSIKPLQIHPFNVDLKIYTSWSKKCLRKYITSGNFRQLYEVSQSIMLYESLWHRVATSSESWLDNAVTSAMFILHEISFQKKLKITSEQDNKLLAILLAIREYFVINNCHDPYNGKAYVGQIWLKPEFEFNYYLIRLHLEKETFT